MKTDRFRIIGRYQSQTIGRKRVTPSNRESHFDSYTRNLERNTIMVNLEVRQHQGTTFTLPEDKIEEFRNNLHGPLLTPDEDGYDQARVIWNAIHDKYPALIARCSGTADVITAVNFAREHSLLFAVRGGGHNVAGKGMCDHGLLIDLSLMKGIRVDPVNRKARAQAGVTWGDFDHETQAFGLATTGGIHRDTGIAGVTLGGGLGYLMRCFGLASDNLLSVDIVTADGQLRTASLTENKELFWGLRGGGGNFGIVVSFEYQLHQVGPIILGGLMFHPMPRAKEFWQFHREFSHTAPDELMIFPALLHSPDGHPGAGAIVCYCGSIDEGEEVIRPLREFGPPVMDVVSPMPYTVMQSLAYDMYPPGRLNYWKSSFTDEFSDEAIDVMIDQYASVPSPLSVIALEHLGGAVRRVGKNESAFGDRDAEYSLIITSEWTDLADSEKNIQWARNCWQAMQPYTRNSVYVNYLDVAEENRVENAYGADTEKYERLVALKNKYDPSNLFRINQNIKPTT